MKVTLIITEHMTRQQLEHSYLLSLAVLNFEHQVKVVFINNAFSLLADDATIEKQWMALKLFGVEAFYCLNTDNQMTSSATEKHCQFINQNSFEELKNESDLLL